MSKICTSLHLHVQAAVLLSSHVPPTLQDHWYEDYYKHTVVGRVKYSAGYLTRPDRDNSTKKLSSHLGIFKGPISVVSLLLLLYLHDVLIRHVS